VAEFVLDASAMIALIQSEPGADRVAKALARAAASAVNVAEAVGKLLDHGFSEDAALEALRRATTAVEVLDLGEDDAIATGLLRASTRSAGLSLGDRACLALAKQRGSRTVTADKVWMRLDSEVEIECIRR
jgi:PIN domain nuclease of toxin-antitoxin system